MEKKEVKKEYALGVQLFKKYLSKIKNSLVFLKYDANFSYIFLNGNTLPVMDHAERADFKITA